MSQESLKEFVVAITGAGKGLGRAYAIKLASLGARVVVNNRTHAGVPSSAEDTVAFIEGLGGVAVAEHSDVNDPDSGNNMLACALKNFGALHGVIANAGISEGRSFHKQSLAEYRNVVETNLFGTVNLLHPVFRHFYDNDGGSILVSTSVAGLCGEHGLPAYSSAKAGLLGLMYSLNLEGAAKGIRVNAIAPYAATQMTQDHLPDALAEVLTADRVAPVAAWLTSPQCPISGEIIVAGAGRVSRARMMETSSVPLEAGGDPQSQAAVVKAWKHLEAQPLEQSFSGARHHFSSFMKWNETE